ncbi:MAG TPA: trypsin-like peptidase domain-containing protein [Fimbriimonadales bacterium]|nr:trypsin-like peptidase domain-containing protein [Fimbriimonadales bacterium]
MQSVLRNPVVWALLAGVAIGGVGMAVFYSARPHVLAEVTESPSATTHIKGNEILALLDEASTNLVEQVMPSVVHIENGRMRGEGSGVIYRADGYIITNEHVVAGSDEVKVTFYTGETVTGKVLRDPVSDIALVKVNKTNLIPTRFADSDKVKPGQLAIAVGSPFGFDHSVTFGHISARGRSGVAYDFYRGEAKGYFELLQTDAAINPGNSGGPLLNYRGEVVGINTMISSPSGTSVGVGFAIPSNTAKVVADQLIEHGKVIRGFMGLVPRSMRPFELQQSGVSYGAIVELVEENSPAYKAGIRKGDVIIEIAGKPVRTEIDVRNAMLTHRPGETVTVKYVRDKVTKTTQVKLGEYPTRVVAEMPELRPRIDVFPPDIFDEPFGKEPPRKSTPSPEERPGEPPKLGVQIRELTPNEKDMSPTKKGVMVEAVVPGSVADRAGVKPGMIITHLGEKEIENAADLRKELAKYKPGDRTVLGFGKVSEGGAEVMQVRVTIRF